MKQYIYFLLFSLFCMLILYILFKIKEISFKRHIQKTEAILRVQNQIIKLEQAYFKCLYDEDFSDKTLVNEYLKVITYFLDNMYEIEKNKFIESSRKELISIIQEYDTLSSNAMEVLYDYQKLLNILYKHMHPVKYKLESYKKNIDMRILYIRIFICKLLNNYGKINNLKVSFAYTKNIQPNHNNMPIVCFPPICKRCVKSKKINLFGKNYGRNKFYQENFLTMKMPKEVIKAYVKSEKFTNTADIMECIKSMFADVINEVYQCELDEQLGYNKHACTESSEKKKNYINGSTKRNMKTQLGEIEISVFRYRNGKYEHKIISKYQRNADGLEDKMLSLYTPDMSIRDIQEESINTVYPFAGIQRCIIHPICSSSKYVSYKHIKEFTADLKLVVYGSLNEEAAIRKLIDFKEKLQNQYPIAVKSQEHDWDILPTPFLYPVEIHIEIMYKNSKS